MHHILKALKEVKEEETQTSDEPQMIQKVLQKSILFLLQIESNLLEIGSMFCDFFMHWLKKYLPAQRQRMSNKFQCVRGTNNFLGNEYEDLNNFSITMVESSDKKYVSS